MTEPQADYGLEGASSDAGRSSIAETASRAGKFAQEKVGELRNYASEGYLPLRVLAQIGGLAMIVLSIMGFIRAIIHLKFLDALVEVYTFLLGIVVIILETKAFPKRFEQSLSKYALFLRFVWGRGCLYFVAGSLQATQVRPKESFLSSVASGIQILTVLFSSLGHYCRYGCGLLHDSCWNHVYCRWENDCQQAFRSPQVASF